LHADVPVPLLHEPPRIRLDVLKRLAARVGVRVDGRAALASEQLIHRHPSPLAEDVPQRHVHAAERIAQHGPVSPVRTDERRLPHVLDRQRVLADEEWLEVFVDGRFNRPRTLRECGAAEAVQPRLVGEHLDDHQPNARRRGEDGADVRDLQRRQIPGRRGWLSEGGLTGSRRNQRCKTNSQGGTMQQFSTIHGRLLCSVD
jgi:hypothetical protein